MPQNYDPNDDDACTAILVALAWLVMICAVAMIICCVLGGCATYTVDQATGEGTSYGFLRNISAANKTTVVVAPDGTTTTTTEEAISSTSTTADLLLGMDKLLGTAVDGASKIKP